MLDRDDASRFAKARATLSTAVLGDVMDALGLVDQFLPPAIRPVRPDAVIVGRAMPVLGADVHTADDASARNPALRRRFGLMFEALDDLGADEVYICTGASPTYALWGELMSTRAVALGAAGAVVDGYCRDTRTLLTQDLPVFAHGSYGQDQGCRGKVLDFRVPIRIGRVWVRPGDIVFGDIDGVCVVPRDAGDEVFAAAAEKVHGETRVRQALQDGMSAVEAFRTFGIM